MGFASTVKRRALPRAWPAGYRRNLFTPGTFPGRPPYRGMPWHNPPRFRRPTPAGFIQTCRPTLVAAPPDGPGWRHEVKHDGFRTLARKQGERVDIWSRYGTDFTAKFSNIAAAVGALPVDNALIDGEAVAFLPGGHSDFAALRTKAGGARASFVVFDLLSLEGQDFRERPLEERRDALSRLVAGAEAIQFSASVAGEGATVFAHACELGLEGIVSKPLQKRPEPELAQVPQPRVSTPVRERTRTRCHRPAAATARGSSS
jgi:ATP dependent DNA ligase domain